MPKPVFYMRNFPVPPEAVISSAFLSDIKELSAIDDGVFDKLMEILRLAEGFIDRDGLTEKLKHECDDEDVTRPVARIIFNVGRYLQDTGRKADWFIEQIGNDLEELAEDSQEILSKEDFEKVRPRLERLLQPIPGLDRQAKAETLCEVTGHPLETVDMICDLRPIFNEERSAIEGMLPLTTLRIVCTGPDGLPTALDALLSRQQVIELVEKAKATEKKLDLLEQHAEDSNIVVPPTSLTRASEK